MRSLMLGTALLVAGSTLALAQTTETTAPAQTAPAQAAPATLANDLRPTFVVQNQGDMVTSKLVGLTIQNSANETIGEIADVVLDEKNTVKSWVVGVGGFPRHRARSTSPSTRAPSSSPAWTTPP